MGSEYQGVNVRFLNDDERVVCSDEKEMPLVLEATTDKSLTYLKSFMQSHAAEITQDIAKYGAVLLRGFDVSSEAAFEQAVLSIKGMQGIREAFMAEEGRDHAAGSQYVLHTNTVYKTGGTLYLGGFHSENYYSTDMPNYICFWCAKPSELGGETGLVNMAKVTPQLEAELIEALEKKPFFVSKWLMSEVTQRYQLPEETILALCQRYDLPVVGEGKEKFILMYKPSLFDHPDTKARVLQINFFEVLGLNEALRKVFMADYAGKPWFWHRFVWRLPKWIMTCLERSYIMVASFTHSPKGAIQILKNKWTSYWLDKRVGKQYDATRVGSLFDEKKVKNLAQQMRKYYASCIWQQGDVLLVDNRQVIHAGMPGNGSRAVRAMICNPIELKYGPEQPGVSACHQRVTGTLGEALTDKQT